MRLTFIRKTALSGDTNCPALYRTDRGTFVVQGWRVVDADALLALNLPPGEDAVEVPLDVLHEIAYAGAPPLDLALPERLTATVAPVTETV